MSFTKKTLKLPFLRYAENAFESMGITERLIFFTLIAFMVFSVFVLVRNVYINTTTPVPAHGGTYKEGIIGTPRFINPLLATTDTDRDLVMLTYSGLMRANNDGTLTPDLAASYTLSKDKKTYHFVLKDNLVFHDGTPLTADDVIFTVGLAQNEALKSTKKADWSGVKIKKINDHEIEFILKKPYAPFLENTTLGILPKHLWEKVSIQEFPFSKLNTHPVGTGPYKIDEVTYNSSGIPVTYSLLSNKQYILGEPFINRIILSFYKNEDELISALNAKKIDAAGSISPQKLTKVTRDATISRVAYPRIFAVFFNQNKAHIFADKAVRKALDTALNKQLIINTVLHGYGTQITSPIPPYILNPEYRNNATKTNTDDRITKARDILTHAGWKFNEETSTWQKGEQELVFTITTANTPELKLATDTVANTWRKLGVVVKVNVFETGNLNKNVIRARDYEALLFGEVVGRSLDLFSFWHSSQRDDPGLNIAMYANPKLDKLLEKVRVEPDIKKRNELYKKIATHMKDFLPAIFLYSPDFIYLTASNTHGINLKLISTQSERFSNIASWYIEQDRIWNFLQD